MNRCPDCGIETGSDRFHRQKCAANRVASSARFASILLCPKGHYYDSARHATCNHCADGVTLGVALALVVCPQGHEYDGLAYSICPQCPPKVAPVVEPLIVKPSLESSKLEAPAPAPTASGRWLRPFLFWLAGISVAVTTILFVVGLTNTPTPPAIDGFYAEPATILFGSQTDLVISARNATKVTIDGVGQFKDRDRVTVRPQTSTSYTLTASGPGGTITSTVRVTVKQLSLRKVPPADPVIDSFDPEPAVIDRGHDAKLLWSARNVKELRIDTGVGVVMGSNHLVTPARTTTYTLTATGIDGVKTEKRTTVTVLQPAPPSYSRPVVDSFTSDRKAIYRNQKAELSWSVSDVTSVSIDGIQGTFSGKDRTTVQPDVTTTYTLRAHGKGGNSESSTEISVLAPLQPPKPVQPPIPATQSGEFRCPSTPIGQYGRVVFDNLPDRKFRLDFDRSAWSATIEPMPNGGRRLVLVSLKPGIQTECVVKWQTVN